MKRYYSVKASPQGVVRSAKYQQDGEDIAVLDPERSHAICLKDGWVSKMESEGYTVPYSWWMSWHKSSCEVCGDDMVMKYVTRFCSNNCQHQARLARQRLTRPSRSKVPDDIECGQCGESFTPKRKDAKFCSIKCRVDHHRAK